MGRTEASVTAPLCLALAISAVLLLALLEAARYDGLRADAKEWANSTVESLFAGYQPVLFDKYRLFLLDGGFGTGVCDRARIQDEMEALGAENCLPQSGASGVNFYRLWPDGAEIDGYRLVTDEGGAVFIMQAAAAMKQEMGQRAAGAIKNRIENMDQKSQEGGNPEDSIKGAQEALKGMAAKQEAEAAAGAEPGGQTKEAGAEQPLQEDPLEMLKKLRKQGILTLVLPKGKTLSAKEICVDNCLLNRKLAKGSYKQADSPGWYERILMQEWMKPFAGNAVNPEEDGALSYGMEYLICGRGSDAENLKSVIKKLLLLREGLNFLYLQQDAAKQAQALSAATAIAGASVNPAVIHAVKEGILAAWAYAESLCDAKALLSGGKIPLMKNAACWQTQLANLGNAVSGDYKGEADGISYEQYLDTMLYLKPAKQAAYRSLDLMELYLRRIKGYEACQMDAMLVGIRAKSGYRADTLFAGIPGAGRTDGYRFLEESEYVYGE